MCCCCLVAVDCSTSSSSRSSSIISIISIIAVGSTDLKFQPPAKILNYFPINRGRFTTFRCQFCFCFWKCRFVWTVCKIPQTKDEIIIEFPDSQPGVD